MDVQQLCITYRSNNSNSAAAARLRQIEQSFHVAPAEVAVALPPPPALPPPMFQSNKKKTVTIVEDKNTESCV